LRLPALGAVLLASYAFSTPHHKSSEPVALAPGYAELTFQAPEPGTYQLPLLGKASDGVVLTSKGKASSLKALTGDKFVLLSFIYTSCNDINGCPLATYVLNKVQRRLQQDSALRNYVRLVSISFDRVNDSPDILEKYADNFRDRDFDWKFLTTPSDADLAHILEAYNQFVIEDINHAGKKIGTFSHILRVYLIDQNRIIRNIYSVSFLHPDIIVNDIRTIVSDHSTKGPVGASGNTARQ